MIFGVPVGGVVVGAWVLITNKSGVKVAGKPNGVAVGPGGLTVVGVPKKGREIGNAVHPARREMMTVMNTNRFMKYLLLDVVASVFCEAISSLQNASG